MLNTSTHGQPSRTDWYLLCAITAIALALSLAGISTELTVPELETLLKLGTTATLAAEPHTSLLSLYSYAAEGSTDMFGVSPFALRLPSVLFGILTVPLVYWIARQQCANTIAHLSALLWAVSTPCIWYACYATGFSALNVFQLTCVGFILLIIRQTECYGCIFLGALLALIYISNSLLLLFTAGALAVFISHRIDSAGPLSGMRKYIVVAIAAVLVLQWLTPGWSALFSESHTELEKYAPGARNLFPDLSPRQAARYLYHGLLDGSLGYIWLLLPVAGIASSLGLIRLVRRGNRELPALILFYVGTITTAAETVSYAALAMPMLTISCILVIEGCFEFASYCHFLAEKIWRVHRPVQSLQLAFAVSAIICSTALSVYGLQAPKQDIVGAIRHVQSINHEGSKIILAGPGARLLANYLPKPMLIADSTADLYEYEHQYGELWVVQVYPDATRKTLTSMTHHLNEFYNLEHVQPGTMKDGDVYIHQFSSVDVVIELTELRAGIHLLTTTGETGGNIAVLSGDQGLLLIDSSSWSAAPALLSSLKTLDVRPPQWVINTHWHRDHTGGNTHMVDRGATVIATPNARKWMKFNMEELEEPDYSALPTRLVETPTQLPFSGHDIRIIPVATAHTDGDILIHVPSANLFHMGDLFVNGSFPYISAGSGGNIDGYLAAQQMVLDLCNADTMIIPGHGAIGNCEDLQKSYKMLSTALDRVRHLAEQGKSMREVMDIDPLSDMETEWGGSWITTKLMAKFIYKTL